MGKKKNSFLGINFQFLSPTSTIRNEHLSKKDVRKIKENLLMNMTAINFFASILFFIINIGLMVTMGISTGGQHIETYGITSLLGQALAAGVSLATIVLLIIGYRTNKQNVKYLLFRIASALLFNGVLIGYLFFIYADAEMGYTTQGIALSSATLLISVLVLIQPVYWTEAIILDLLVSTSTIGVAIGCNLAFGMTALPYYILLAVIFPIACYAVKSVLFYAEAQRYCQVLRNEALCNTVHYDEVTHCKNRFALKEFLQENTHRWETNKSINLLIIMFDIDDFKLYNDQFSHLGGDYCLRAVADSIRKVFPSPGLDFYRYGGEEFLLFLELRDPDDALMVTEQVRNAVKEMNIPAPKGAPKNIVTISVGSLLLQNISSFNFEENLMTVDKYLYAAKDAGKDVSCYNGRILK